MSKMVAETERKPRTNLADLVRNSPKQWSSIDKKTWSKRIWWTLSRVVVAVGVMWTFRELDPGGVRAEDTQVWEIFLSVFGLIYAVLIGLLLVEALSRFHEIATIIQNELNAVSDMNDFLRFVDHNEKPKREIKTALLNYMRSVTDREWDEMKGAKGITTLMNSETSDELNLVMDAVNTIKARNASDRVALDALINKVAETTSYRTKRLELSHQLLSPALNGLIILISVIIVGSLVLMNVVNFWIHTYMVSVTVIAFYCLRGVLRDLDHPFDGFWNINRNQFDGVISTLEGDLDQNPISSDQGQN